jgi:hypothetical protein
MLLAIGFLKNAQIFVKNYIENVSDYILSILIIYPVLSNSNFFTCNKYIIILLKFLYWSKLININLDLFASLDNWCKEKIKPFKKILLRDKSD